MDGLPICSNLDQRIKQELDSTQLSRWSRQHLAFYDLDLLKIEHKTSDGTRIAYLLWKPGLPCHAVGLDLRLRFTI